MLHLVVGKKRQFSSDYFYFLNEIMIPGHQQLLRRDWKRWCRRSEENGKEELVLFERRTVARLGKYRRNSRKY